ncbi:hypothetical protein [Xenorhabdus bovienii]|uniref:hypothetical protein n=1 Tax=Xenorhabdus bovienii TaxID=40576 RepID=UPI0023B20832|nr:hypothetical protein [Xenorhabdus bovienii]MDE9427429.1 hypothetical protein [Xenorhabdus bovienii]MDE9483489.1 hypothetical protein [Xenorhabdus bovienii]MDE9544761.1 hypothetical protein [Xenorhabdus bovienii]
MNEKDNNSQELKSIDGLLAHKFKPKDIYLATLAMIAEEGVETGVTLFLNGVIVSGIIISNKRYSSNIFDRLNDVQNKIAREMISDLIVQIEGYVNGEDNGFESIEYLHLYDVKIVASNGNQLETNSEMRIKLAEVNGFILGNFSPPQF